MDTRLAPPDPPLSARAHDGWHEVVRIDLECRSGEVVTYAAQALSSAPEWAGILADVWAPNPRYSLVFEDMEGDSRHVEIPQRRGVSLLRVAAELVEDEEWVSEGEPDRDEFLAGPDGDDDFARALLRAFLRQYVPDHGEGFERRCQYVRLVRSFRSEGYALRQLVEFGQLGEYLPYSAERRG